MNEYMFFIRKTKNSENSPSGERLQEFRKACETYSQNLKQQGVLLSAEPMDWSGKIISGKGNDWKESDYKEPEEVIAGYYHILANDLEEAIEIAKENPEFMFNKGTRIEVHQLNVEAPRTDFVYPSETV